MRVSLVRFRPWPPAFAHARLPKRELRLASSGEGGPLSLRHAIDVCRSFQVFRVIPFLLILVLAACSKGATKDAASTQPAATEAGAGTAAEAAKPLPEKLPDVIAKVNGESVT